MDTPPDVMMTSARLIPSFKALSKSSGLQKINKKKQINDHVLPKKKINALPAKKSCLMDSLHCLDAKDHNGGQKYDRRLIR